MAPTRSKNVSAVNVTGPIADLLRPFPVIGAVAGALQGLASSWLSKTTNGLLNDSGFEIGSGTSDRLLSVSAGSCAVSAQEAVTVRDGWAGEKPIDIGVPCSDKPTLPGPAAERLEYVYKGEWSETTNIDENLFPKKLAIPQCLFIDVPTNPSTTFLPNAARHALSRASFTVVVTVNANPFTSGVLLVVAVPNVSIDEDYPPTGEFTPISQLTLYPHQFINLKTNNQATLHLPYHGPGPLMEHHSTSLYRICGFVFSKPVKTSSMSGGTLRYTIQVAPMDVEFYGLHYPIRPNRDLDFVANQGLAVRLAPNAASIVTTSPLEDVVVLAQGSQTELDTRYLPGNVESFCQPLAVPTRMARIATSNGGFDVGASDVAGTIVYAFPVDLANIAFEPTYLGSIAKLFTHWTGEICFSLMCAANSMTRGRLLVSFLPGVTEVPSTMELAMLGTFQVYDIGLNSTFVFPIPYISMTSWRRCAGFGIGNTGENRYYDSRTRAGVISVWVYTDFQTPSPNNATTVSFIPFISASSNFAFRLPQDPTTFVPPYDNTAGGIARHEAPEPTVHMGSADAESADSAPTQAPVDGSPASYTNLEPGQPSSTAAADVWEGMTGFTNHTSPDMLLANYYGRMRLHGIYYGSPPAPSSSNPSESRRYTTQKLIPIYWGSFIDGQPVTLQEHLTSLFLYAQADVRVDIVAYPTSGRYTDNAGNPQRRDIRVNATNQSKVRVVNLPPGYAKFAKNYEIRGDDYSVIPPENLLCFPSVTTILNGPSNSVSVYIPYQSLYNAIPASFGGFGFNRNRSVTSSSGTTTSVSEGQAFGILPDKEFCTILLDMTLADYYTFEVYTSFHNLRTYIPRPFRFQGRVTTLTSKLAAMNGINGYSPSPLPSNIPATREKPMDFFQRLMEENAPARRAVKPAASGVSVTNP